MTKRRDGDIYTAKLGNHDAYFMYGYGITFILQSFCPYKGEHWQVQYLQDILEANKDMDQNSCWICNYNAQEALLNR